MAPRTLPLARFVLTLALPLSACDKPGEASGLAQCSADDLLQSEVVATTRVERTRGKQELVELEFTTAAGDDVCVHVSTGKVDETGTVERAAAAVLVELDESIMIAKQSDFNAHPQNLARLVPALDAGAHTLTVDAKGKPGSTTYVSVLRKSASTGAHALPQIGFDRLHDPTSSETFVRDETVVAFEDFDDIDNLEQLPFSTVPLASLQGVPIVRVYLPGVDDEADLQARLEAIEAVDGVLSAGKHRIGGVRPTNYLPQSPGQDEDYLTYSNNVASLDSTKAWHLQQINADRAWTANRVTGHHLIGVMDNGFNTTHPGFASDDGSSSNIDGCWYPSPATFEIERLDCEVDDAVPDELEPPSQCGPLNLWQNFDKHGTMVAGLIGARGQTDIGGSDADTMGVLWTTHMHFARFTQSMIVPSQDTIYEEALQACWLESVSSDYGILLTLEQMILGGVSVINMSFSNDIFDLTQWSAYYSDPNTRKTRLDETVENQRELWTRLLRAYSRVLVVQAAGNDGDACAANSVSEEFCTARASGFACAVEDELLAKQVLCVGASDKDVNIWDETNRGGDPIAAPGVNVYGMSFDGGLTSTNGTSLSAPLVTAAAAMLMDENPQLHARVVHDFIMTGGSLWAPYDNEVYRILDLESSLEQVNRCADRYQNLSDGVEGCPTFSDVDDPNQWYYEPVLNLACNCILDGDPEGTFRPGDSINRAEALKIALELALPEHDFSPTPAPFSDVPDDAWYAGYADFAADEGIINFLTGGGNQLQPDKPVERGQFIQILVNAAALSDEDGMRNLWQARVQGAAPDLVYADVKANTPGNLDIYAATAQCVATGHGDPEDYDPSDPRYFGPSEILNRAEASKIGCLVLYGYGSRQCGEVVNSGFCTPYFN